MTLEIYGCFTAEEIVDYGKAWCDIFKDNSLMTDLDIAIVMRCLGERFFFMQPKIDFDADEKPILNRTTWDTILSLTLLVFPDFFARHELAQYN